MKVRVRGEGDWPLVAQPTLALIKPLPTEVKSPGSFGSDSATSICAAATRGAQGAGDGAGGGGGGGGGGGEGEGGMPLSWHLMQLSQPKQLWQLPHAKQLPLPGSPPARAAYLLSSAWWHAQLFGSGYVLQFLSSGVATVSRTRMPVAKSTKRRFIAI